MGYGSTDETGAVARKEGFEDWQAGSEATIIRRGGTVEVGSAGGAQIDTRVSARSVKL